MTIEKSTFVASSVFRDVPVPSAQIKLQQPHMPEVMPPGRYSPVNDLDYSSDDSGIEFSAQEFAECAAVCQAITSSKISRQFPASCHSALHSDARSLVRLLIHAPIYQNHIATAQPQSLLDGIISIVCEDFHELRALFLHHRSAALSTWCIAFQTRDIPEANPTTPEILALESALLCGIRALNESGKLYTSYSRGTNARSVAVPAAAPVSSHDVRRQAESPGHLLPDVNLGVADFRNVDEAARPDVTGGGTRGPAVKRSRATPGSAGAAACDDLNAVRAHVSTLSKDLAALSARHS